jgi:riboflavin kinase/FMN adenylyltransferase
VRVEFVAKLREELAFDSLDALRAQIARDAHDARAHFARADGTREGDVTRATTAREGDSAHPLPPPDSAD